MKNYLVFIFQRTALAITEMQGWATLEGSSTQSSLSRREEGEGSLEGEDRHPFLGLPRTGCVIITFLGCCLLYGDNTKYENT